ncbi:hypothetical protein WA026_002826 [Henosepilachna vigintioctopunctata]|uniref:Uncharacterized protein n=1 Tax=Henosepilachna vigintioctopunctata TaxID=420089 RepID=A0AAW1TW14_9CUCU
MSSRAVQNKIVNKRIGNSLEDWKIGIRDLNDNFCATTGSTMRIIMNSIGREIKPLQQCPMLTPCESIEVFYRNKWMNGIHVSNFSNFSYFMEPLFQFICPLSLVNVL